MDLENQVFPCGVLTQHILFLNTTTCSSGNRAIELADYVMVLPTGAAAKPVPSRVIIGQYYYPSTPLTVALSLHPRRDKTGSSNRDET